MDVITSEKSPSTAVAMADAVLDSTEQVLWSELYKSGKVNRTPLAVMLTGEYREFKSCKLDGDSNAAPSIKRVVIYNREFMLNQMAKNYRFVLTDCTAEEWIAFCAEAYARLNEPIDLMVYLTACERLIPISDLNKLAESEA